MGPDIHSNWKPSDWTTAYNAKQRRENDGGSIPGILGIPIGLAIIYTFVCLSWDYKPGKFKYSLKEIWWEFKPIHHLLFGPTEEELKIKRMHREQQRKMHEEWKNKQQKKNKGKENKRKRGAIFDKEGREFYKFALRDTEKAIRIKENSVINSKIPSKAFYFNRV